MDPFHCLSTNVSRLHTVKCSVMKWKSSFKPIDDPDDNSPQDGCPDSSERYSVNLTASSRTQSGLTLEVKGRMTLIEAQNHLLSPSRSALYDPYNPVSPDSEHEISQGQDHSRALLKQKDNPEPQPIAINKSRWDVPAPASRPPERDDRGPDGGPSNSRALNPSPRLPEQQTCNLASKPFVPAGYGSVGGSLDHRVGILGPSPQRFPASYRPQRTNDEERMIPDYRGEVSATVVFIF